eukprot:PhM_4_TR18468/c0_g1_i1/m.82087
MRRSQSRSNLITTITTQPLSDNSSTNATATTATQLWTSVDDMCGQEPPYRIQTATCHLDGIVYVFGGRSAVDSMCVLNDMYAYDIKERRWRCIPPNGVVPTPRKQHVMTAMVSSFDGACLYLYGGTTVEGVLLHDFYQFSLSLGEWACVRPPFRSAAPSDLVGASLVACGGSLYLFGAAPRGPKNATHPSYFFRWEEMSRTWHDLSPSTLSLASPTCPEPRSGHTMCCVDDNMLLLHGGVSVSTGHKDDIWLFNTTTQHWRSVVTHGVPPTPRVHCAACIVEVRTTASGFSSTDSTHRYLALIDGDTHKPKNRHVPVHEVHYLDISTWQWMAPQRTAIKLPRGATRINSAVVVSNLPTGECVGTSVLPRLLDSKPVRQVSDGGTVLQATFSLPQPQQQQHHQSPAHGGDPIVYGRCSKRGRGDDDDVHTADLDISPPLSAARSAGEQRDDDDGGGGGAMPVTVSTNNINNSSSNSNVGIDRDGAGHMASDQNAEDVEEGDAGAEEEDLLLSSLL